jgi:putative membrane protein
MRSFSVIQILLRWAVSALGVLIAATVIPGIGYDKGSDLVIVVLLLSVLNAFIRPILVFFALPFVIFTLGFGILLINALLFMLAAHLVDGFQVDGYLSAFFGALIVGMISLLLSGIWSARVTGSRPRRPHRWKPDDVIDI